MDDEIHAIMNDESLTEEEKAAKIAELKRKFALESTEIFRRQAAAEERQRSEKAAADAYAALGAQANQDLKAALEAGHISADAIAVISRMSNVDLSC